MKTMRTVAVAAVAATFAVACRDSVSVTQTPDDGAGPGPVQGISVARQWNEVLLEAIRNDFARPTVHARNLCHVSAAMYDAWARWTTNRSTGISSPRSARR